MRRYRQCSPNKPICTTTIAVGYRGAESVERWGEGGGGGGGTLLRSTRLSKRFHDCRAGIDALTREPFKQPVVKIKQLINSAVLKSMAALLPPLFSFFSFFQPCRTLRSQDSFFFSLSLSPSL